MPRKARNPVRKRNLLKMRNQTRNAVARASGEATQVVNVVVKNTKTIRKRESKPSDPVMSRNRLLPPTPSVTVMNQQPDYRTLLSLLSATGRTPTPAQPSQGLINNAPTVPQSQGLASYLTQQSPQSSSIHNSPISSTPMREYDTPIAPPNSVQPSPTPTTRILTEVERLRYFLLANIRYVPTTKTIKTPEEQIERIRLMKRAEDLIRLKQLTEEEMKRSRIPVVYPTDMTARDFAEIEAKYENQNALMANMFELKLPPKKTDEELVDERINEVRNALSETLKKAPAPADTYSPKSLASPSAYTPPQSAKPTTLSGIATMFKTPETPNPRRRLFG